MKKDLTFLLLQTRKPDDPIRHQEVRCFEKVLPRAKGNIKVHDLISSPPSKQKIKSVDVVLLGGSGDFWVVDGGPWLEPSLESMRYLAAISKPTFASCWGFHAMAKALGGKLVKDPQRAELGIIQIYLTAAGKTDPIIGPLGPSFEAVVGHEDTVDILPTEAVLLASSEKVVNHAFRLKDKPIYCTQFHPEIDKQGLIERVRAYPEYIKILGMSTVEEFIAVCRETPQSNLFMDRFISYYFS